MAACGQLDHVLELLRWNEDPFGACSGGTCEAGGCTCPAGRTGRSDFVNTEGQDCQLVELVVQVLWGVQFAAVVVAVVWSQSHVRAKWAQHLKIQAKRSGMGRSFKLLDNRSMMAILSYLVVCAPASSALAWLRIFKSDERVGLTPALTALFAISKIGFYMAAYYYQPALLHTILKGQHRMRHLVRLSNRFAFWNMLISSALGLLPFITLALSDGTDDVARAVYVSYFAGSMVSMAGFGGQAYYIKHKVLATLTRSFEMTGNENVNEIKDRLIQFQNGIVKHAIVQFIIYSMFLLLAPLWNKHDYFLPISWLVMPLLYTRLARSTVAPSKLGSTQTGTNSYSKTGEPPTRSFNPGSPEGLGHTTTTKEVSSPSSMTYHSMVDPTVFKERTKNMQASEGPISDDEDGDEFV